MNKNLSLMFRFFISCVLCFLAFTCLKGCETVIPIDGKVLDGPPFSIGYGIGFIICVVTSGILCGWCDSTVQPSDKPQDDEQ